MTETQYKKLIEKLAKAGISLEPDFYGEEVEASSGLSKSHVEADDELCPPEEE